jgi:hypothetical protein
MRQQIPPRHVEKRTRPEMELAPGASDRGGEKVVGGGWGGRIRTFNLLIQSQLRYRCATPQRLFPNASRATHSKRRPVACRYSRVITTFGFSLDPGRTVIRIEKGSPVPMRLRKKSCRSVLAL